VYGESWVTFGYGVVLDFSNEGGDLRLCEPTRAANPWLHGPTAQLPLQDSPGGDL